MSFMDNYKKKMSKEANLDVGLLPDPEYFLHTGSYSLNRLMSAKFEGGAPQGRLVGVGGHASSGKSLVGASILAENLKSGGYGVIVDSEGALDNKFLQNVGIDVTDEDVTNRLVRTATSQIGKCSRVVNKFIQDYSEEGDTTPVVILVDSLDMLFTDSEQAAIEKEGELGGDQGQRAKQLKRMILSWTHSVSKLPITIICTKQVYVEQDKFKAYEEPWVFTESLKYPFSQIIIVEKLQWKDKTTKEHKGFTLKAKSYKNRHAEERQVAKIEVPFGKSGLDPYAGLIEIAEQFDVVKKNGGWYTMDDGTKFQKKAAEADTELMQRILKMCIAANDEDVAIEANLDDYVSELDDPNSPESIKAKRQRKAQEGFEDDDDNS